jgi:hypothetical protein
MLWMCRRSLHPPIERFRATIPASILPWLALSEEILIVLTSRELSLRQPDNGLIRA